MAEYGKTSNWTAVAENDLSSSRYLFVELSGDNQVDVPDNAADIPFGILQNEPEAGQDATVAYWGISKLRVSGTITAGAYISSDASGSGVIASSTAGTNIGAQAITGAASGSVITAKILQVVLT